MECIKKNTAIFLHTLCIFVCYVSNEHDDDMALNTKQRQKCINRFLFQFFIRIFTRLTEDISVALFIWFSSHTPKNWLSRYASSVIHWNVYVFVCAFFSRSTMNENVCPSAPNSISIFYWLHQNLISRIAFELHLRMKYTFDTGIYRSIVNIQLNSIKMAQVFAPVFNSLKCHNGFASHSFDHTAICEYNSFDISPRVFNSLNWIYLSDNFFFGFWHTYL